MEPTYTNVQGLVNNYNQIKIIATTENPDFLILSETHLTKDIDEQKIALQSYDNIESLSTSSRTAGIVLYFKKNRNMAKFKGRTENLKCWMLLCKAVHNNNHILIGAIYRSSSYNEAEFFDIFEEILISTVKCVISIVIF